MTISTRKEFTIIASLAVASLALWFFLGFPWRLHNESLIWDIALRRASFWDSLASNPVATVQTYRPLGLGLAWLTFHLTAGNVWLQQLCNFSITAAAWVLALRATDNPRYFAWLSFACGAAFFSGYIYLFHLHGVFYGPLLVFLAYLMLKAETPGPALHVFLVGSVFALFHPFALLLLIAFMAGLAAQNLSDKRPINIAGTLLVMAVAALEIKLLTHGSSDLARGSMAAGLISSYRGLEFNRITGLLSLALTLTSAAAWPGIRRSRRFLPVAIAAAAALSLMGMGQPVIFAWILACVAKALWARRFIWAALISICALLPVATGTGTPTYAVFVMMPCIAVTVLGWPHSARWDKVLSALNVAVLSLTVIMWAALRAEWQIPLVTNLVRPLYAEREKTYQLAQVFSWLDQHPALKGTLTLCHPAEFPVLSGGAINRVVRAPSDEWAFDNYLRARYAERLVAGEPHMRLCFGGERLSATDPVLTVPGRWAGLASIEGMGYISQSDITVEK